MQANDTASERRYLIDQLAATEGRLAQARVIADQRIEARDQLIAELEVQCPRYYSDTVGY